MLVVADNINVAYGHVAKAIAARDGGSIRELAHRVDNAGADVIDLNLGPMNGESVEILPWLVEQVQSVSKKQISLDAHSSEAIMAAAEKCVQKPIINTYFVQSAKPQEVKDKLLPFAAERGLEVILPTIGRNGPPLDPDERASLAADLVGAALETGLTADMIFVDPVVIHLSGPDAQEHALSVMETMKRIPSLFDNPPVKTIAGVDYLSAGAPQELHSPINRTMLAMLGALGLDAAMVNVTDPAVMRDIRLIRALRNESLYSVSDAETK